MTPPKGQAPRKRPRPQGCDHHRPEVHLGLPPYPSHGRESVVAAPRECRPSPRASDRDRLTEFESFYKRMRKLCSEEDSG